MHLKKFVLLTLSLLLGSTLMYAQDYGAQRINYNKDFKPNTNAEENASFKDHLIYGGGLGLGFSGGQFRFAISPTVGYKFNKVLSAGVTLGYQYNFIRDYWPVMDLHTGSFDYENLNMHVFSPGVWTRALLGNVFFLHAEFEYNVTMYKNYNYDNNNQLVKVNNTQAVPCLLLGGGIRQQVSENVSYVIYGLYDALQNSKGNTFTQNGQTFSKSPYANTIDIRVGLLYGF